MADAARKVFGLTSRGWAILAVGGLLLLQRKRVMLGFQTAFTAAQQAAFKIALPAAGRRYGDVIFRVAQDEALPPAIIAALMEQESAFGQTLSPPGPGGTGDAGHGHGLMQIDDRSFGDWLTSNDWTDPYTNVRKGAQVLKGKMKYLSSKPSSPTIKGTTLKDPRPLSGDRLFLAALAAYNTGEGNVAKSIARGLDPDTTTADAQGYAKHVVARAQRLTAAAQSTAGIGTVDRRLAAAIAAQNFGIGGCEFQPPYPSGCFPAPMPQPRRVAPGESCMIRPPAAGFIGNYSRA